MYAGHNSTSHLGPDAKACVVCSGVFYLDLTYARFFRKLCRRIFSMMFLRHQGNGIAL